MKMIKVDFADLMAKLVILLILVVAGGTLLYGVSWFECFTFAGQEYDVTVTVQAVEKSTRFWDHTNVWVQVYGEQDITYRLHGHHDLELGKTYDIKFRNKMIWHWLAGFQVLGKVESISIKETQDS